MILYALQSVNLSKSSVPVGIHRLDFLVGEWTSIEKSVGPDGKPALIELKGKNTWALDGRFLQIDETFTFGGKGHYENKILMSFEPKSKKYKAWWFTDSQPTPIQFVGDFGSEGFALESGEPGRASLRILYTDIASNSFSAQLQVKQQDRWTVRTDAKYSRKKN